MDEESNILKRIQEVLGGQSDNYSILDHQIDVKLQMEYFEFSRNQEVLDDPQEMLGCEPQLYNQMLSLEERKALLVNLASIELPEAYRIIERYVTQAPSELKDWAIMAQLESRMLLETVLLDESQIFISTGLGGKEGKLRYFAVIFTETGYAFTETQQRILKGELELRLNRQGGVIENLNFANDYATVQFLLPIQVVAKEPITLAINECNTLGRFVRDGFIVTNVKILTDSEIDSILEGDYEGFDEI